MASWRLVRGHVASPEAASPRRRQRRSRRARARIGGGRRCPASHTCAAARSADASAVRQTGSAAGRRQLPARAVNGPCPARAPGCVREPFAPTGRKAGASRGVDTRAALTLGKVVREGFHDARVHELALPPRAVVPRRRCQTEVEHLRARGARAPCRSGQMRPWLAQGGAAGEACSRPSASLAVQPRPTVYSRSSLVLPAGGTGGVGSGSPLESASAHDSAYGWISGEASKPKTSQLEGCAARAASGTRCHRSRVLHQLTPASM